MPRLTTPNAPQPNVRVKRYDRFSGVDFSTDPSTISDSRSPNAPNLISDAGGYPEKRVGWRALKSFGAQINGIFRYHSDMVDCYIVHAGDKIYKWDGNTTATELKTGVADSKSFALMFREKLVILTGSEYLAFDGTTLKDASEYAYVPTIITGKPSDKNHGGLSYQPVNMLTPKRRVSFTVLGEPDDYNRNRFNVGTSIDNFSTVRALWSDGTPIDPTQHKIHDYDLASGLLVFDKPFNVSQPPGTDSIIIEFEHTTGGHASRIAKCNVAGCYNSRVFFAGNPYFANVDWFCELNDPFYVPDINYTEVGTDGSAIIGYTRIGDEMVVLKEDNGQDANIFLRSSQMTDKGMIFPVKQGIAGAGAVNGSVISTLLDDPLFLSKDGVYGIASQSVTAERVMQIRSTRINARLARESNLKNATACIWNGYYVLCVNGNVYLADSRQRTYARNESGAYEYEWYHWTNVPAVTIVCYNDVLYFGTADGKVCRFNHDMLDPRGGYKMDAYNDNGKAIVAEWSTRMDDDGDFNVLKTLQRRGSGAYLKSYNRSDVKILIRTDHDFGQLITDTQRGIFNFKDIDFTHFTFNTLPNGFVSFPQKVKKYRLIQVVCRNDQINQGFGVYAIERRFVSGYYGK